MEEVFIKDKQTYLNENYIFENVPKLNEKKRCIHCDKIFTVADYKVFKNKNGDEFICCPNAPDCDGTLIDWVDLE